MHKNKSSKQTTGFKVVEINEVLLWPVVWVFKRRKVSIKYNNFLQLLILYFESYLYLRLETYVDQLN